LQPDLVVETGTALAQTALVIGRILKQNGHGRLVSLEVSPERVRRARERVRGLPVEVIECSSLEYSADQPIDFAWLDSLPELRAPEFRRYWPAMHANTIVGFHDTGPTHDLRPAIDELADEGLLRPIHLATPRGVTFAQVLQRPAKGEL
jgi:predicted O-methyltransferase YrrM